MITEEYTTTLHLTRSQAAMLSDAIHTRIWFLKNYSSHDNESEIIMLKQLNEQIETEILRNLN